MDNVKFFDKNGVEVKVGDVVIINGNDTPRKIKHFTLPEYASGFQFVKVYFSGHDTYADLSFLTKHTPKLTKVRRTFEEVCDLVAQGCLFKTSGSNFTIYNPIVDIKDNCIRVDYIAMTAWQFKRKNSETWEELEYKEVEE